MGFVEQPKHSSRRGWLFVRNKELFLLVDERSKDGSEQLLSVSEHDGVTPKVTKVKDGGFVTRAKTLVDYKRCQPGDLVINIMLAWRKGLGVSQYNGIVSPAYAVFRPKAKVCSKYYHFLFRTKRYASLFKQHSKGIIDSRLRLYPERFLALRSLLPPIDEQRKIVAYLDDKISVIKQTQVGLIALVERIQELEVTLIDDVVNGLVHIP